MVVVGSHATNAVVRNNRVIPFAIYLVSPNDKILPNLIYSKTRYWSQIQFTYALVYVYIACLCNFITYVDSCAYDQRDVMLPFLATAPSFPNTLQPLISVHLSLVLWSQKMLYKWNNMVCNLLGLAFFIWQNFLKIHTRWYISIVSSYLWVVVCDIDVP